MKKHPMPADTALDVIERERGRCAVCGLHIVGQGHIHHRKPRGMGGAGMQAHRLSNLLYLHPSCHLRHVESKRENALMNGWLLEQWQDPWDTPLVYMLNGWALLKDDLTVWRVVVDDGGLTWHTEGMLSERIEDHE
jgi:hypothetical protein